MNSNINLIRNCSWEEVFLTWYKNEGENFNWQKLAKERGFASWADWRINGYAKKFECAQAEWGLYEINNPSEVVANWFGGPFRTWIERYYTGAKTKTFSELASLPELHGNSTVKTLAENYPAASIITALELKDGRIFVIEGSHRSCALALMAKDKMPAPEKLIFAIGKSDLSELPVVGQNNK